MTEDKTTLRVGSLDELTEHIRKNYGTEEITLTAELNIRVDRSTYEASMNLNERRGYPIRYTFKDAEGRDIVYDVLVEYLAKKSKLSEDEDIRTAIRIFITADDTLSRIKSRFPNIETRIYDLEGEIFDEISWAILYDAQIHEIKPLHAWLI